MPRTRRDLLALVPRVTAHPTHAVVDGVTYPGGLAEYRAAKARADRMDAEDRQRLPSKATRERIARILSAVPSNPTPSRGVARVLDGPLTTGRA